MWFRTRHSPFTQASLSYRRRFPSALPRVAAPCCAGRPAAWALRSTPRRISCRRIGPWPPISRCSLTINGRFHCRRTLFRGVITDYNPNEIGILFLEPIYLQRLNSPDRRNGGHSFRGACPADWGGGNQQCRVVAAATGDSGNRCSGQRGRPAIFCRNPCCFLREKLEREHCE